MNETLKYSSEAKPSFRNFLRSELLSRIERNPQYSLRAFSKSLGIEASSVSQIINGKRIPSERLVSRLSLRLGIAPEKISAFSKETKEGYQELDPEVFRVISDWYHYAILELTHLKTFKADSKWIAKKLNIHELEASSALERLQKLGLLVKKGNTWCDTEVHISRGDEVWTSESQRRLQKQILLKAIDALENIPVENRNQSAMTMAISQDLLPKANAEIRKFRRKMAAILQAKPTKSDSVYHLSVSLYPVTSIENLNKGRKK